jgi:hypothetical protein
MFDELRSLLAAFCISIVYCDDNVVYKTRIVESVVNVGKRNAHCIEVSICLCVRGVVGLLGVGLGFRGLVLCIGLLLVWLLIFGFLSEIYHLIYFRT